MITGIQGGSYSLVIQDQQPTVALTVTSTASEIANALSSAASQLPNAECTSFGVTVKTSNQQRNVIIRVEFNVDRSQPLSLLSVYSGLLEGNTLLIISPVEIFNYTHFRIKCYHWCKPCPTTFSPSWW